MLCARLLPCERLWKMPKTAPTNLFRAPSFPTFFEPFRHFSTFFPNFRTFSGFWGTEGAGIGKFTQKQFFPSERSRKSIIKMPENRTSKFPEKCKCLGPVFRHFYNAFPSFLGREKSFLRELSDPRPLSPPKSEKDRKIWKKAENPENKMS